MMEALISHVPIRSHRRRMLMKKRQVRCNNKEENPATALHMTVQISSKSVHSYLQWQFVVHT